jgi:hypothetical protein
LHVSQSLWTFTRPASGLCVLALQVEFLRRQMAGSRHRDISPL